LWPFGSAFGEMSGVFGERTRGEDF